MLIDWLAFNCDSIPENQTIIRDNLGLYTIAEKEKYSFFTSGGRISRDYRNGIYQIDLSSKALSFYQYHNIKNLIFLSGLKIRRIDIAYDDRFGTLDLKNIWERCNDRLNLVGQFSDFEKRESLSYSGKRTFRGFTVYSGKRSSHSFIRFYDKLLESYRIKKGEKLSTLKKRFRDLKKNPHWIRCEIEFKQDNADKIFKKIISEEFDPTKYLYKLIDFKDEKSLLKRKYKKPTADFWKYFLQKIEKEKLGLPKNYWSLESLETWIDRQVTPSLYGLLQEKGARKLLKKIQESKPRFIKSGMDVKILLDNFRTARRKYKEERRNYLRILIGDIFRGIYKTKPFRI